MKILQITNSLLAGGAEKLIVDTTIQFQKKGIEADVLLMNGVKTPFYERLDSNGRGNVFFLGISNNIYNPLNIFKLRKYVKGYDVIHVHLFPSLYWVAFAKALGIIKCPIVFTEHNTTNRRRSNPILSLIDKFCYARYSKIITISDAVDSALEKHLGKNLKSLVKIYNGIDLSVFEGGDRYTKEDLGYKESDRLIIQVASFTPQKDQSTLINAMVYLPDSCKLLLVGKGPLLEENQLLVKKGNLEDRVSFLGIRKDVPKLLKSCDVAVLSSHYEGLSLSSVEGLASGNPFIATDAPGLEEVVKGAGLLVKPMDSDDLADKILSVVDSSPLRKEVIEKCLSRAKRFDIQLMVNNYILLYENCLTNNNKKTSEIAN